MTIINSLKDANSVVDAWREACSHLMNQSGRKCTNLIYSVKNPSVLSKTDLKVISDFDEFAKKHNLNSSTTVANTIFPVDTYLKYGSSNLYSRYMDEVFPRVTTNWGTYFERMVQRRDPKGNAIKGRDGQPINPLESLTSKVAARLSKGNGTKTHYEMLLDDEALELTTYLPERDRNYQRGGPCLSHASFKVDGQGAISLTAIYRSHFYVERALGNLLGLARLQSFVAQTAGGTVGPLTVHAVSAVLESAAGGADRKAVASFLADVNVK